MSQDRQGVKTRDYDELHREYCVKCKERKFCETNPSSSYYVKYERGGIECFRYDKSIDDWEV